VLCLAEKPLAWSAYKEKEKFNRWRGLSLGRDGQRGEEVPLNWQVAKIWFRGANWCSYLGCDLRYIRHRESEKVYNLYTVITGVRSDSTRCT
jgi:hypothetical protein